METAKLSKDTSVCSITIMGSNMQFIGECERSLQFLRIVSEVHVKRRLIDPRVALSIEALKQNDLVVLDLSKADLQQITMSLKADEYRGSFIPRMIVHTSATRLEYAMLDIDPRISVIPRGATPFDWKRALRMQGIEFN